MSSLRSGQLSHVVALVVVALLSSIGNAANWSYDFDGAAPATWTTSGQTQPLGGTLTSFSALAESGYLRISDTTNAASGGAFSGFAGTSGDVFTDASVQASVNITGDTDDDLGLVLRYDNNTGNGYYGSVDYERGEACITKIQNFHTGQDLVCSAAGIIPSDATNHVKFTATGGSGDVDLTFTVMNADMTSTQATVTFTDDGTILGGTYDSGIAGAYIVPQGTTLADAAENPLNGTFDNLSASVVPEPNTGLMLLFAIAGLLGLRRRS